MPAIDGSVKHAGGSEEWRAGLLVAAVEDSYLEVCRPHIVWKRTMLNLLDCNHIVP